MKVFFDISSLDPKKVTGVGVYMIELLKNLSTSEQVTLIPVIKPSRLKKRKSLGRFLNTKVNVIWPWTGIFQKNALYHGPDFKLNAGPFLKRIVTIHDMVVFEKLYNQTAFYEKGITALSKVLRTKSLHIIANSEFTKSEILKHFPQLKDNVQVTLLGCNRKLTGAKASEDLGKYLLFLGTLEKRKNLHGVIKSFELLYAQNRTEYLVLAGAWGFGKEEIQNLIKSSPAKDRIKHLSYVPNEKIESLIKGAEAFIFPSFYEGFGIPVLEAMSLGCPVVTSDTGALNEITVNAAIHANPYDPQDIANKISTLLDDSKLREDKIALGYQQATKFTWAACAKRTIEIYKEVAN